MTLTAQLDALEDCHGAPKRSSPRRALDGILWENCAYLVDDNRRLLAFRALKKSTQLTADGIVGLPPDDLYEIAETGGMMPERRVGKLLDCAQLVLDEFDGDLEQVLGWPVAKARRALKRFPGIGDPGADKILLFTGAQAIATVESNGLRVLQRLGHAAEAKSYSKSYRAAQEVLRAALPEDCAVLVRAFELLRRHGRELCKHSKPQCGECPLAPECPAAD